MVRTIVGVIAGLAAWLLIGMAINLGILANLWPAYKAVLLTTNFTLPMMIARLSLSAVCSLSAGAVTAFVAPRSIAAPIVVGVIQLGLFVPMHVYLWDRLPAWYHLTFLISLVPLAVLGNRLARRKIAAA